MLHVPASAQPLELTTRSAGQTEGLGAALAPLLSPGDLLLLAGALGTGKTVLVRGVARGLGFAGPVTSPTFTIIHTYPEISLCHVDAYRLAGADDLLAAGIEDFLDGEWICAVEWADRVSGALPPGGVRVTLAFGEAEDDRTITVQGEADRLEGLAALAERWGRDE